MLLAPCQTSWSRTRDTFVTETVISFNHMLCQEIPGDADPEKEHAVGP